MKIVTVLGARPQFIKAGSVSREILRRKNSGAEIQEVLIHTGQHFDENMSDVFFRDMGIPEPDHHLGIGGKAHGEMTGQMIEKVEVLLVKENPDYVLVYGDTNSTLAGALAASKLKLNIAHVEAGLRSFNMDMPEEINRILTDRISRFLFCPTEAAVANLENEGIRNWGSDAEVVLSGDVMQDSAIYYRNLAQKPSAVTLSGNYNLCTIHRAENTDNPERLGNILSALNDIAGQKQVLIPIHPRTRKILEMGSFDTSNLTFTEPVGYLSMVWLIEHCDLVLTDSVGLQKEAFFFSKPCLTLRDETEWVELVDHGFNTVTGADKLKILNAYHNAEFNQDFNVNFYGAGRASEVIVSKLIGDTGGTKET